jgi:transcriptional regulator with XRE-family HTH domain
MGTNFWGVLIRGLREEQGISQRTLSALTGVNRSTLRKIEAGETVGDIAIMESLLDFLGYELEAIQKGVAVENRSRVAASRILSIDLLSGFDLVKKPTLE